MGRKIAIYRQNNLIIVDNEGILVDYPYLSSSELKRQLKGERCWRKEEEELARIFLGILRGEIEAEISNFPDWTGYPVLYLQYHLSRACTLAAREMDKRLKNIESLNRLYERTDYWAICWYKLSDPVLLLRKFSLLSPYKMQNYAIKKLLTFIRETLLQENRERRGLKYRQWGLLRDAGQQELRKALQNWKLSPEEIEKICLIWQSFLEIYTPKQQQGSPILAPPTEEEYQQITDRFNQRRFSLSSPPDKSLNIESIKDSLNTCIRALEEWRSVRFFYPDQKNLFDEDSIDQWEDIALEKNCSEQQINNFQSILSQSFNNLSSDEQAYLKTLEFGVGLTQKELALVLNIKQYTISRRRQRSMEKLLKNFINCWNNSKSPHYLKEIEIERLQQLLKTNPNSSQGSGKQVVIFAFALLINSGLHRLASLLLQDYRSQDLSLKDINFITQEMKEQLRDLCFMILSQILQTKIEQLDTSTQNILKCIYSQRSYQGLPRESPSKKSLESSKKELLNQFCQALIEHLAKDLNTSVSSFEIVSGKINTFCNDCLVYLLN